MIVAEQVVPEPHSSTGPTRGVLFGPALQHYLTGNLNLGGSASPESPDRGGGREQLSAEFVAFVH